MKKNAAPIKHLWHTTAYYLLQIIAVTLIYSGSSWLGHFLEAGQRGVMPIPLAAGIALTVLLLFGLRLWPGILLGQVILKYSLSIPYTFIFFDAAGATLQALLAAWLLQKMHFNNRLLNLRDVLLFAAITVLISAPIGATIANISLWLKPIPLNYIGQIWLTTWSSDAVSMLVLTGALLTWRYLPAPLLYKSRQILELLFIMVCLAIVTGISLTIDYGNRYLFFYMILPFVVWAAVRFEQYGATLGSVIVAIILLTGGLNRLNLEGRIEDGTLGLMLEIAFIALTAFTASLVAAAYSARREAEENVIREKELALATLHSIANAVITTDEKGYVHYLNPAAESLLQSSHSQALHKSIAEVFRLKSLHNGQSENPITRCLHGVVSPPHQSLLITCVGQEILVDSSAAPIRHRDGHIAGVIIVCHTALVKTTKTNERDTSTSQPNLDAVTGLTHRQTFEYEVMQVMLQAQQEQTEHVLLHLESDFFKTVYTRYGQVAGNSLLQQWTKVLQKRVRQGDIISRLSGQSFALLLKNCPITQAESVCQQFVQAMAQFVFHWNEQALRGQLYVGAVPITGQNSDSAGSLLKRAAQACQVAYNSPIMPFYIALTDLPAGTKVSEESRWSDEIRQALTEQRLLLYQQRIVSLDNLHLQGVEILLRLKDKEGAIIPAARFLPLLGRYSQILRLDRWVVQQVFNTLSNTPNPLSEGLLVHLNLSRETLSDSHFIEFVRSELQRTGLKSWQFCFEINEVDAHAQQQKVGLFIKNLRQLGCQVGLDNFGSHAASLHCLQQWPVNYLKLDGHLVQAAINDPFSEKLLCAIHELSSLLHIHTIATWVEDETTINLLKRFQLPFIQGFGIAKPEPFHLPLQR